MSWQNQKEICALTRANSGAVYGLIDGRIEIQKFYFLIGDLVFDFEFVLAKWNLGQISKVRNLAMLGANPC